MSSLEVNGKIKGNTRPDGIRHSDINHHFYTENTPPGNREVLTSGAVIMIMTRCIDNLASFCSALSSLSLLTALQVALPSPPGCWIIPDGRHAHPQPTTSVTIGFQRSDSQTTTNIQSDAFYLILLHYLLSITPSTWFSV